MNKWKVQVTDDFQDEFIEIIIFIQTDKPGAAKNFKKEILEKIRSLKTMPYRNRQSIYFDDQNIRDIIHKGYTITYLIEEKTIQVFSILKHRLKP